MSTINPPMRRCGAVLPLLIILLLPRQAALSQVPDDDEYLRKLSHGLELLGEVYRMVVEKHAGAVDPLTLAESGIKGMLGGLDPYSTYIAALGEANAIEGTRMEIGVDVEKVEGGMRIVEIVAESPAERSGLRIGDVIRTVDGAAIEPHTAHRLYEMLDGEEGSEILIGIERPAATGSSPHLIAVARAPIRRGSLGYAGMLNDDIIYLDLDRFGDNAGSLLRSELLRLGRYDRRPSDVAGVILDLRGNSGGIIDEAVEVAAAFLPQGSIVVSTVGRSEEEKQIYKAQQGAVLPGAHVVVLVDSGSASAAEIVAAALQDYDAAVIVGAPTVGKGLVQTVYGLPLDASLRLTTSWYVAPSGRSLQRRGLPVELVPDSLLGIHRTGAGRDVPGGSGVVPDTLLPAFAHGALLPRLERSRIFGDYADTIAGGIPEEATEIVIDEATMAAFERAALGRLERIERERGALHLLDSLHDARGSGDERIEAAWSELARALTAADRAAFATLRPEIERRLHHEVERRLLTRRERDAHRIAQDPGVIAAIALLRDHRRYQKIVDGER